MGQAERFDPLDSRDSRDPRNLRRDGGSTPHQDDDDFLSDTDARLLRAQRHGAEAAARLFPDLGSGGLGTTGNPARSTHSGELIGPRVPVPERDTIVRYLPPYAARQQYDELHRGRMWANNIPRTEPERDLFAQQAIALGHPAPEHTARVLAQRHELASRTPGAPVERYSDIFGIAWFGLGFTIQTAAFADKKSPHVLGLSERDVPRKTMHLLLERSLIREPEPPRGEVFTVAGRHAADLMRQALGVAIHPYAWEEAIDASYTARFALAWAAATYLTDPIASVIVHMAPLTPPGTGAVGAAERCNLRMIAACHLLAPLDRLQRQIHNMFARTAVAKHAPQDVAALCSHRWRGVLRHHFLGSMPDPEGTFLRELAVANRCPELLIERQLDSHHSAPEPSVWGARLLRELSALDGGQNAPLTVLAERTMRIYGRTMLFYGAGRRTARLDQFVPALQLC